MDIAGDLDALGECVVVLDVAGDLDELGQVDEVREKSGEREVVFEPIAVSDIEVEIENVDDGVNVTGTDIVRDIERVGEGDADAVKDAMCEVE